MNKINLSKITGNKMVQSLKGNPDLSGQGAGAIIRLITSLGFNDIVSKLIVSGVGAAGLIWNERRGMKKSSFMRSFFMDLGTAIASMTPKDLEQIGVEMGSAYSAVKSGNYGGAASSMFRDPVDIAASARNAVALLKSASPLGKGLGKRSLAKGIKDISPDLVSVYSDKSKGFFNKLSEDDIVSY